MDEATLKIIKEEWRQNLHRDADFKKFYSMKTVVDTLQVRLRTPIATHLVVFLSSSLSFSGLAFAISHAFPSVQLTGPCLCNCMRTDGGP